MPTLNWRDGESHSLRTKKAPPETGEAFHWRVKIYFTLLAKSVPALNFATFLAGILISVPVCGLRPVRAARLVTAKVPKPTSDTEPPFFRVVFTAPMVASKARVAAALEMSACLAMCSISSVLFTKVP